jgi:hypothetical protein
LLNFSALKYSLLLEQETGKEPLSKAYCEDFIEQVAFITPIIHDQLGLKEFTRIGFRAFYLFNCETEEQAARWLDGLGLYKINQKFIDAFGSNLDHAGLAAFIVGEDRKYRIALNVVEQNAHIDLGQEILNIQPSKLHENQRKIRKDRLKAKYLIKVNPTNAAMIDIDAFIENPITIEASKFISSSLEQFYNNLGRAI